MPELSRFHGVIIRMYWHDHHPPHFHARYGNQEGVFSLGTLGMLAGDLPPRTLGMVVEWAASAPGRTVCRLGPSAGRAAVTHDPTLGLTPRSFTVIYVRPR